MTNLERREKIIELLTENENYITATALAQSFGVTRQIIVSDIAILRAQGNKISAAKNGYKIESGNDGRIIESIVCRHSAEEVLDELYAVVDNGGYVIDVIVEHPVYGQLSGELNIHSRFDVDEFVRHVRESGASQLCDLTGGLHIHTLSLPDKSAYDRITRRLREMGILIE